MQFTETIYVELIQQLFNREVEMEIEMDRFSKKFIRDIKIDHDDDLFLIKVYEAMLTTIKDYDSERFNASKVSSFLFISERTLHRRLNEKNISYLKIKDEVRKKLSIYLLCSERYAIKEISHFLKFNSPASFVVSFKRWYFCTPKEWENINFYNDQEKIKTIT